MIRKNGAITAYRGSKSSTKGVGDARRRKAIYLESSRLGIPSIGGRGRGFGRGGGAEAMVRTLGLSYEDGGNTG